MSDEQEFDWSKFEKDRIKFDQVGVEAVGDVVKIGVATLPDPNQPGQTNSYPEISLLCDDGKIRTVLCSQTGLQELLAQHKPQSGDRVKIKFISTSPLGGGRTAKNFEVTVKQGGAKNAPATAAAASPASGDGTDDDF